MRKFLPAGTTPSGFGVPFSFYDDFMKHNGLYAEAQQMMAEPRFHEDAAYREQKLTEFRRRVRRADVPPALETQITALQQKFPANAPIRCRSSTNNEDLEGFNGAGLYDSYTHRPDEGQLSSTLKQVWASLWNFRAFEERQFWKIDHMTAAMGVLVHENEDDEQANGVAITKNIYDPNWPGFYVNAQVGESLVTNPTGAVPDELLVSAIGPNMEYEVQRLRRSSENGGKPVLSDALLQELVRAMEKIQAHFKRVYGREDDKSFAMDIEWKITDQGKLSIKQARPVVS
jgi:phosphoenolpyruvate synthase/pyruvate phosphate dikinase